MQRFSAKKKDLVNVGMHLTNVAVQKTTDEYHERANAQGEHFSFALLGPHRGFLDLTECAHVHEFRRAGGRLVKDGAAPAQAADRRALW